MNYANRNRSNVGTLVEWADCEGLERRHSIGRGSLILLDVIISGDYASRRGFQSMLELPTLELGMKPDADTLYKTPHYCHSSGMTVWNQMQEVNRCFGCDFYEGVVAKRGDSLYPIQLRSPEQVFPYWVKHRWTY